MPRKKTTDFDNYTYQQQYIKQNLKFVNVPFNSKFPDEMKLYDYLNEHSEKTGEKKGTFIKRLIRESMMKEMDEYKTELVRLYGEDETGDTFMTREEMEEIRQGKKIAKLIP